MNTPGTPEPDGRSFFNADQLCAEMVISKDTLSDWVSKGILPAPMFSGGKVRVWYRGQFDKIAERQRAG